MDRLIHTVMNSMATVQDLQAISAQNLANQNVPGYRRDLSAVAGSERLFDPNGLVSRVFQIESEKGSFSAEPGFMDQTGETFDIAIMQDGYFYAQEGNGKPGLTRRGDLRTDATGALMNGANEYILNSNMQKITLPPYKSLTINDVGQVLIEPMGGEPGIKIPVATIATVVPDPNVQLGKGLDALIRPLKGEMPRPNQQALIRQGVLEGSNINTTEELINTINLQRNFEMNMRMVLTAKELDESGAELMRAPMA